MEGATPDPGSDATPNPGSDATPNPCEAYRQLGIRSGMSLGRNGRWGKREWEEAEEGI